MHRKRLWSVFAIGLGLVLILGTIAVRGQVPVPEGTLSYQVFAGIVIAAVLLLAALGAFATKGVREILRVIVRGDISDMLTAAFKEHNALNTAHHDLLEDYTTTDNMRRENDIVRKDLQSSVDRLSERLDSEIEIMRKEFQGAIDRLAENLVAIRQDTAETAKNTSTLRDDWIRFRGSLVTYEREMPKKRET